LYFSAKDSLQPGRPTFFCKKNLQGISFVAFLSGVVEIYDAPVMHLSAAKNTSFSRSLLAGIVCGILAAILNMVYTVFYRKATDFTAYKVVEPLLIFIAFPLLFVIAGFIFFEMVENIRKGRLYFTILSLVMMAIALIFGLRPLEKGSGIFCLV
jgi:drug/metabolite transporter (DMT)-like permease